MIHPVIGSGKRRVGVIAGVAMLLIGAQVALGQRSALRPDADPPTDEADGAESPPAPTAAEKSTPRSPTDILARIEALNDGLQKLGPWEEQSADIVRSMNNLWAQNGWNDEADRYALDLAQQVVRIPPWEFNRRMETLSSRMKDRYDLTDSEAIAVRGKIVRELGGILFRNASVIFKQGAEYIEVRGNKQPFTPEQIAAWTKESESIWKDSVSTIERLTAEIRATLDPEQQEILDRDLASFHRRVKYWSEKREAWRAGRWRPEDWGMQDDPIQLGLKRPGAAAPPSRRLQPGRDDRTATPSADPASRGPGQWLAHDPKTWMAYVEHVAERYEFDEAQRNTGRSLHKDKFDRAAAYANAHEEALGAVPASQRDTHVDFEPIRAIFAELQRQLEAIPTPQQKQKAPP